MWNILIAKLTFLDGIVIQLDILLFAMPVNIKSL